VVARVQVQGKHVVRPQHPLMPSTQIVLGDLNTLSPLDADAHRRDGLVEALATDETGRLQNKFLKPKGDDASEAADYDPMQMLLNTPLFDLAVNEDAGGALAGYSTVPTEIDGIDPMHSAPMRIDFVLASPLVAPLSRARALQTAETHTLSDHYPVRCRVTCALRTGDRQEL